jgi:tetratricopeptide (TPR) repeat protein
MVAVVAAGSAWFAISAKRRKEAFAARALQDAQAAVSAGNLPLATSDLSRMVTAYRGTAAASEAAVLLGQLRLSQGQPDSAIAELRAFLRTEPPPRFRAAAQNLLGAALEQTGRSREAAEAYEQAAATWPYEYLQDQAWLDAARMFRAAGDTARAAKAYETILRQHPQSPSALEAKLRLAELRQGDIPTS